MSLGGKRVIELLASLPSPSTAQPSTNMKKPTCAESGCVCADCHVNPEEQVVVRPLSANFRDFPRISATFPPLSAAFRHFPPISANFRQFPRVSAPFAGAVEGYPAIFRTISAKFPQLLEVQCALRGHGRTAPWSLWCTVAAHQVKGVVVVLMSGQ